MIDEDDTILIQTLTDSFGRQLEHYRSLREVVRQIMSKLVLSRGSMAKITEGLHKKQHLVEQIEMERHSIAEPMLQWQQRKASLGSSCKTEAFSTVLDNVTTAIRGFLDDEEQLQKYLEGIMSRTAQT